MRNHRKTIQFILAALGLLACAACTPNAQDFLEAYGYDASGVRTGSVLPSDYTLTPY